MSQDLGLITIQPGSYLRVDDNTMCRLGSSYIGTILGERLSNDAYFMVLVDSELVFVPKKIVNRNRIKTEI